MLLLAKFYYDGFNYVFPLDTKRLDRNYDDEDYAYWLKTSAGRFFEINIHKTQEVDGEFTDKGWVKCYKTEQDFFDDEYSIILDLTFEVEEMAIPNDNNKCVIEILKEIAANKHIVSLLDANVIELRTEIYPYADFEGEPIAAKTIHENINAAISFIEEYNEYFAVVFIDGLKDYCLNILDL